LISLLLDLIVRVGQSFPSSRADLSYVEQLLMSAIENAAEGIAGLPNLAPSTIRLDILVELIRASNNPQTFHQALLLISKLSRFATESALHNVMPIFTFMGSNVFHRDDTYSFKVVQQTIDSIVPFMVSSLKQSHVEKLDLHIASKDFLHIFTDASNHIPRHRRNHFFFHLVDVLGPADFLAPTVMLMVAKLSNRVIRQTPQEARGTLTLPVAVLQHFSPSLQMSTLTEILNEVQRLVSVVIDSNAIRSTFLGESIDDFKRHATSLIVFVGIAIASSSSTPMHPAQALSVEPSPLVSLLVALAAFDVDSNARVVVEDIQQAAHTALNSALASMPATSFVASVLTMLESQSSSVRITVLVAGCNYNPINLHR
jgi:U3 small nucleolar RNA-associated protein 10